MAKKARQRISYVLESEKSSEGGHRLGVNGLAVDTDNSILYSGGREGKICAWDLNLDLTGTGAAVDQAKNTTKFRAETTAHTHWINDIVLAHNNTALVSASSDLTVKLWRPHSEEDNHKAVTIGEHADYVKCVAAPPKDLGANWVASGSLDRTICLWDLNGGGKTLEIDVRGEEQKEKGSVYALSVGRNILGCGGPEKTVRLYDPRTGSRISKLVGHLDNIRSMLIDETGDTILSASADKTIKMWSVRGGRCMYTFTMHEHSVWCLYSDDPRLGIFYSSDRSGLIAKTDVRGSFDDMDDGLSLAVLQEHSAVVKTVAAGGHIWTATEQSSINRWEDIDLSANIQLPNAYRHHRAASAASSRSRHPSLSSHDTSEKKKEIPSQAILRISNTAVFPTRTAYDPESNTLSETLTRKGSEVVIDQLDPEVVPIHQLPTETIEGQFGLLKHKLLNDRRHVLTTDTAGEVLMWDLIQCKPIKSFGKQFLEDVEGKVNTREAVAPWCSIDLSSGNLTVVLEPFNCFDAEVYADELELDEPIEFRDDQRISLGRWVLRYLFANLIDEEIRRDEDYRQKLNEGVEQKRAFGRANAPTSIAMPENTFESSEQTRTPRANGPHGGIYTPGLAIGLATPGPAPNLPGVPEGVASSPMSAVEKRQSQVSRPSVDRDDYFTSNIGPADTSAKPATTPAAESTEPKSPVDGGADKGKDKDKVADTSKSPGAFGKKFKLPFGTKKLGRSASQTAQEKPAVVDEKAEESESSSTHEKEVDDSFYGVIQKIRRDYDKQVVDAPTTTVETRITPSLPIDTPVLKLDPSIKVFLQEETSGGNTNIYQGTVGDMGKDADLIEQKAPMWLGDALLLNQLPFKEAVKISFVLHPIGDLPVITSADGNNRLNANRMLRVKKILSYISEKIEAPPEEAESDGLMPEEYLELYCNEQLLDPLMSLASLRTHVWKGGNDIVLHYKANGRKEIRPIPPPASEQSQETEPPQDAAQATEQATGATQPAA